MAISNSKPNFLLFSALLIIFSFLLNNVNSQSYPPSGQPPVSPLVPAPVPSPLPEPETISFGFSSFESNEENLAFLEDASVSAGVIQLTKKDYFGKPLQNSIGQAGYIAPIHLWDKTTDTLADFTTSFSFVVNPKGQLLHGDGFAFFMIPIDFDFPVKNSTGGYLGLFSPDTALDPTKNQILAIEFDSYGNEWDLIQSAHVGIDVNSIRSVESVAWPSSSEPDDAIVHASINYNSETKSLSVFFGYNRSTRNVFSHVVDLRTVLPEWVFVGFSGATGELVETHDILSWSFDAAL